MKNTLQEASARYDTQSSRPKKDHKFKIKGSLVTEKILMDKNFLFDEDFKLHKLYKRKLVFLKPFRSEDQTDEEFKKYSDDITYLFELYKDAVNHEMDCDASEFCHFHYHRGELHENNRDYDNALLDHELAIKGAGDLSDGYLGKGRVLLYTGKVKEALKQFEIALEISDKLFRIRNACLKDIRSIIKTSKTKQPKYNSRLQDWFSSPEIQLGKK